MSSTTELTRKKRKRYTPAEKDVSAKLSGKLHHGLKEIRKSVKKAKVFETQKLVKKLKNLREPPSNVTVTLDEIVDLEAQMDSLKHVDQERIARVALSTKIRKDRTLSSNNALHYALASVTVTPETQQTKVENRLLSSKVLASEVNLVLSGLKAVLEPASKSGDPTGDMKAHDAEDAEDAEVQNMIHRSDDGPTAENINIGAGDGKVEYRLNEPVEGIDDVDDGWESGSVHPSVTEDDDNNDSLPSEPSHKRIKGDSAKPRITSTEQETSEALSTFLPSLSVGFIKGGSESDFDELSEANTRKKNRRGQRARQAIWEKRYGKNAKHVKKRREESEALATAKKLGKRLDSGWGEARGSSNNSGSQFSRDKPSKPPSPLRTGTQAMERPTHPSWEAKKKLKEKESAKILPPQGKRIVFY